MRPPRAVLILLAAAAACTKTLPLVDVEIDKIRAWVERYAEAGMEVARDREIGLQNPQAAASVEASLANLRRVYPHPDGARYTDQEIAAAEAFWAVKLEAARKREGELFALRMTLTQAQRDALARIVVERADTERRLDLLKGLGAAVRR